MEKKNGHAVVFNVSSVHAGCGSGHVMSRRLFKLVKIDQPIYVSATCEAVWAAVGLYNEVSDVLQSVDCLRSDPLTVDRRTAEFCCPAVAVYSPWALNYIVFGRLSVHFLEFSNLPIFRQSWPLDIYSLEVIFMTGYLRRVGRPLTRS